VKLSKIFSRIVILKESCLRAFVLSIFTGTDELIFAQINRRKKCFFKKKTLLNYANSKSKHWFLRRTATISPQIGLKSLKLVTITSAPGPGLPDGIFSKQKIQICINFGGP
jgi:hypothetical protein